MQLSEARVFEMMGRLHAENRALAAELAELKMTLERAIREQESLRVENARLRAEFNAG